MSEAPAIPEARSLWHAIWRGARRRCPACGRGALFAGFLSVVPACAACGEALHHQRADDAPAYFTIVIVGHVAVGGVLWAERAFMPEPWVQAAVWLTVAVVLSLVLLPCIKGMLVGLQWALRMHGFGGPVVEHEYAIDPVRPRGREKPGSASPG